MSEKRRGQRGQEGATGSDTWSGIGDLRRFEGILPTARAKLSFACPVLSCGRAKPRCNGGVDATAVGFGAVLFGCALPGTL
jgi:hypothetical protein